VGNPYLWYLVSELYETVTAFLIFPRITLWLLVCGLRLWVAPDWSAQISTNVPSTMEDANKNVSTGKLSSQMRM